MSRLEREGSSIRLARGLYQLPDASIDTHHSLAELAKLVPKGVVCLTSALSFHGLTDQIPAKVWMAIGPKNWRPRLSYSSARFVHFPQARLATNVEQHLVSDLGVVIEDLVVFLMPHPPAHDIAWFSDWQRRVEPRSKSSAACSIHSSKAKP